MEKLSNLSENLIGSEIIKLSSIINKKVEGGINVLNLTIGDFDSDIFNIPSELKKHIIENYTNNQTNYPPASGEKTLLTSINNFYANIGYTYNINEIMVAGGSRPLIYAIYKTILNEDDKVLYATPSWNNNHYTYLSYAQHLSVETTVENNFLLVASEIEQHISNARLISLCSPQNPTGTIYSLEQLTDICKLIIQENEKRKKEGNKLVYLMYDQVYWMLIYNNNLHYHPIQLFPEMKEYTIYVDGISKNLAATGLRVGWTFAPKNIVDKMKAILGHIGAWSPKAEQLAVAQYLQTGDLVSFITDLKRKIELRLNYIYDFIIELKKMGFSVDAVKPMGGLYLSLKLDLGYSNAEDLFSDLVSEANIGIVPFYAFGSKSSKWFRISVGTLKEEELEKLKTNLSKFVANKSVR